VQRLRTRLTLASHLGKYLREQLEAKTGYTCALGISTNKLLSKLVGSVHKPNDQTTLLPYISYDDEDVDNVTSFMDSHEIGRIPGIGFKMAQRLRMHVLNRPVEFDTDLMYGGTKEVVLVEDVRKYPGMGPETLERILGGPGTPQGIGNKVWDLLNGYDDTEVSLTREVPKQISIEDSYIRLDTLAEVTKELRILARSLLKRMHADLLKDEEEIDTVKNTADINAGRRWLAYPKTIRLSTRLRQPPNSDGRRNKSFARASRSTPMPNFVFSLKESIESLSDRLVSETLMLLYRKLHPEKSGWNLSLVNIAATNMVDAASERSGSVGRSISKMFKQQDEVLRQWRTTEADESQSMMEDIKKKIPRERAPTKAVTHENNREGSEDLLTLSQKSFIGDSRKWESENDDIVEDESDKFVCEQCGSSMPVFAAAAHFRWHTHEQVNYVTPHL